MHIKTTAHGGVGGHKQWFLLSTLETSCGGAPVEKKKIIIIINSKFKMFEFKLLIKL